MPRFYFDLHDGRSVPDDVGLELESVDAARKEVWRTLPAIAAQRRADGNTASLFRIDVRDESGKPILHAALTMVIEAAS